VRDIELVHFVRAAKDRGMSVKDACQAYRKREGRGTVDSLVRRYERIATAFPDNTALRTLPFFPRTTYRTRAGLAAAMLLWKPSRKLTK
jgi:hypothetical protein